MEQVQCCVVAIRASMERLKHYVTEHPWTCEEEEIYFFREVKPVFCSKLIYYVALFRLESRRPSGSRKLQKKYLEDELRMLDFTHQHHREFYQYYRSGATYLDQHYFVRGKQELHLLTAPHCLCSDSDFHTSHDYIVAELQANERIGQYIMHELAHLQKNSVHHSGSSGKVMAWTASKAALIELVYALCSYGAYNHGRVDVKEIASHFEQLYQIDLGNFYRCFQEIRIRKKSRTSFIDQLREKLERRMDDADEHPRFS